MQHRPFFRHPKYLKIGPFFDIFVSTKFHFDETISLAGLMSFVRRRRSFVVPHLWKLCDGITFVILELHFWDLVHCLLISFCFGSEILKKIGPPQPQKKTKKPQKKTYGFSRWDNLPTLWVWRLGFGIVLSNIFLLWIWRFGEIRTPLTPPITVYDLCDKASWPIKVCTNNLICIMSFWFSLIVFSIYFVSIKFYCFG